MTGMAISSKFELSSQIRKNSIIMTALLMIKFIAFSTLPITCRECWTSEELDTSCAIKVGCIKMDYWRRRWCQQFFVSSVFAVIVCWTTVFEGQKLGECFWGGRMRHKSRTRTQTHDDSNLTISDWASERTKESVRAVAVTREISSFRAQCELDDWEWVWEENYNWCRVWMQWISFSLFILLRLERQQTEHLANKWIIFPAFFFFFFFCNPFLSISSSNNNNNKLEGWPQHS